MVLKRLRKKIRRKLSGSKVKRSAAAIVVELLSNKAESKTEKGERG